MKLTRSPQGRPGDDSQQTAGTLDLLSLGALVHRLDPGIIPFRKAARCDIHVSGGNGMDKEKKIQVRLSLSGVVPRKLVPVRKGPSL